MILVLRLMTSNCYRLINVGSTPLSSEPPMHGTQTLQHVTHLDNALCNVRVHVICQLH